MTHPNIVELTIAAPVDIVWHALRDPEEIRRWFGWEFDGLDEEIAAVYDRGATVSDADRTLDTGAGRFELEPTGETTIVRITRAAPAGRDSWDDVYDEINEGWLTFAQQLRFYLERHRGEVRRSAHVKRSLPLVPGEPWFTSAHQAAVVVDKALMVATQERTILSAYGLDDRAFAELRNRLGI